MPTDEDDITALQTPNETEGGTTAFGVQDLSEICTAPNNKLPLALSQQDELMMWHH